MGNFWFSKAPWRTKQLVFTARVQQALLTGMEAYVMTEGEYRLFDRAMLGKLRAMLQGKAREHGPDHVRTWPNVKVWKHWKLVPTRVELAIRRGRWLQALSRRPTHHAQTWIALCGMISEEDEAAVDEAGCVRDKAHPWAQQLAADLCILNVIEDMPAELQQDRPPLGQLAIDTELAEDFCKVDLGAMRAASWTTTIPPTSWHQTVDGTSTLSFAEEENLPYLCDEKDEDNNECGHKFATWAKLQTHKVHHHRMHCPVQRLVVCNQCPYCSTVFSSKKMRSIMLYEHPKQATVSQTTLGQPTRLVHPACLLSASCARKFVPL